MLLITLAVPTNTNTDNQVASTALLVTSALLVLLLQLSAQLIHYVLIVLTDQLVLDIRVSALKQNHDQAVGITKASASKLVASRLTALADDCLVE